MKKYLLYILLAVTPVICAQTQRNCPKRIVPGDIPVTDYVPTRTMNTDVMHTPGIGTLTLPPRVLVIMVNFANYSFSTTKAHADSVFNAHTPLETDLGEAYKHLTIQHESVASYFNSQSLGQYRPQFDVVGPVTLSKDYNYYGQGAKTSGHAGEMVAEACKKVNDSVDFTRYDADNDTYIDLVFIFFAGFGENDGDYIDPAFGLDIQNLVWPHYSTTTGGPFDGKNLRAYECSNELDGYLSTPSFLVPAGSGVLVHEFSHGMGLPDVYRKDQTKYMGTWDLMDYGCYNNETFVPCPYTGYERWFCGWSQPKMMNTAKNDTLRPIAASGDFGVISATGKVDKPNAANEYWIIENHQQEGWDMYAQGNGLILYRIKYHNNWSNSANYLNTEGYILCPADGILRTQGWVGKQGDCYPYQGKDSIIIANAPKFPITNIKQEPNGDITFQVCGGKPTPTLLNEVNGQQPAMQKIYYNGAIYIRRGTKIYTLTGNETHLL